MYCIFFLKSTEFWDNSGHLHCLCNRLFRMDSYIVIWLLIFLFCFYLIQSHYRGWLMRRHFLLQREAVIRIQSAIRCLNCQTSFQSWKFAATEVQRFIRGHITRTRLLGRYSGDIFPYLSICFFFRRSLNECLSYSLISGFLKTLNIPGFGLV